MNQLELDRLVRTLASHIGGQEFESSHLRVGILPVGLFLRVGFLPEGACSWVEFIMVELLDFVIP